MNFGTASCSCKWCLKSIPKPKRNFVKVLSYTHIHLPREIFPHSYPRAQKEQVFLKLTTIFISITRDIYTKLLTFSENSVKMKVTSSWTLFVILLTSAVIFKQRFLHGREIMQYLQNFKCYDVDQSHFRKHL